MAILIPFCNLISLFSSIEYDDRYEISFWSEIYGCVNYLNLPYDTVMNLPIYIRKFWIQKHNMDIKEGEERATGNGDKTIGGVSINAYARMEQGKSKMGS